MAMIVSFLVADGSLAIPFGHAVKDISLQFSDVREVRVPLGGGLLPCLAPLVFGLAYANIGLAVSGIGLWPTVLFHAAMTAWCVTTLR